MECPFQAFTSTFTCGRPYCAAPVSCCLVDTNCSTIKAYPMVLPDKIEDPIDLIHKLPNASHITFSYNGIMQIGLRIPNTTDASTLSANVSSLAIYGAFFNVSGMYLPRALTTLAFEESFVIDNSWPSQINRRKNFWPPSLTHISMRNNNFLSFADATSTTAMDWPPNLVYLDLSLNLIETFENLPFVHTLNMSYNRLHQLQAMDLSEAAVLDFSNNPYLTSLDLVMAPNNDNTTRLHYLYLQNSPLTWISTDVAAFAELRQAHVVMNASAQFDLAGGCASPDTLRVYDPSAALLAKVLAVCVNGGPDPDEARSGLGAGAIVAIVVASVVVVAAALAFFWRRRHQAPTSLKSVTEPNTEMSCRSDFAPIAEDATRSRETQGSAVLQLFRIDAQDIELLDVVLGLGSFGHVVLGRYKGKELVAIKALRREKQTPEHVETLLDEIELMTKHAQESYMEGGDLQARLQSTRDLPWAHKVLWARHIALGLVYLHGQHVIHRDVKSRNVLLTADGDAKLADLGIARHVTEESMTNAVGTYRWTAPEVLKGKHYDTKADIYSFGMVLTELDSHAMPYADFRNQRGEPLGNFAIMYKAQYDRTRHISHALQVMQGKITPSFSPECPQWLQHLALHCIAHAPDQRPSATDLIDALNRIEA
ncbi:protein kinase [Achlya hypogyna]|uniref:Protein kinase n=1 Tax=Achlya hypogyna TaxID=1202772 RepID=A0A1V9ZJA2_ACHHY|nr:protein kinase [Achlya hypogyna]